MCPSSWTHAITSSASGLNVIQPDVSSGGTSESLKMTYAPTCNGAACRRT